jgi:hypothetical protein
MASTQKANDYEAVEPSDPIRPGCPMLIRAAAPNPVDELQVYFRCGLGWNVIMPEDNERCARVGAVDQCWQDHPDRLEAQPPPVVTTTLQIIPGKVAAD